MKQDEVPTPSPRPPKSEPKVIKTYIKNETRKRKIYSRTALVATSLSHSFRSTKPQTFIHNDKAYVLLSQKFCFTIISGETGRHVRTVGTPDGKSLSCICYSQTSIWVGCQGSRMTGTLLEYPMDNILRKNQKVKHTHWIVPSKYQHKTEKNNSSTSVVTQGNSKMNEMTMDRRRRFEIKYDITHIAAPHMSYQESHSNEKNRILYCILHFVVRNQIIDRLLRLSIPLATDPSKSEIDSTKFATQEKTVFFKMFKIPVIGGPIVSMHSLHHDSVLVVKKTKITIVNFENGCTSSTYQVIDLFMKNRNQRYHNKYPSDDALEENISSISPCPGGKDLAIGFTCGRIRIFINIFESSNHRPGGYLKHVQHRILHWHKHPVTALAYLNPNVLLSGGEEAVLVSWQVGSTSSGTYRPIHTLPRLFRGSGGITHINSFDYNRALLMGEGENALKMVTMHDYHVHWHLGSIAFNPTLAEKLRDEAQIKPWFFLDKKHVHLSSISNYGGDKHYPILQTCPISQYPILSGLNGAPGFVQMLSPSNSTHAPKFRFHTVLSELEVAVYNRVSRSETGIHSKASLIPRVSHFAFSSDGTVLVTVDKSLSELGILGRKLEVNNDIISETTSLKFWERSNLLVKGTQLPYELNSVMTNPHGHFNDVCGLTITHRGTRVITMSSTERAFRLWTYTSEGGGEAKTWKCQFKIATPLSLYSFTTSGAMAFNPVSNDEEESILAVAYGNMIGLWDVSVEKEYPILLRTIFHNVNLPYSELEKKSIIEKLLFTKHSGGERIISISPYSISCQSLFPGIDVGWKYVTPDFRLRMARITAVEHIKAHNEIAFALANQEHGNWIIKVLDASNGKPSGTWGPAFSHSNIKSMKYGFMKSDSIIGLSADTSGTNLYALSDTCKLNVLLRLNTKLRKTSGNNNPNEYEHRNSKVPKLEVMREDGDVVTKMESEMNDMESSQKGSWSMGIESSNLPILSGSFFRNFLGDKLKRNETESENDSEYDDESDDQNEENSYTDDA